MASAWESEDVCLFCGLALHGREDCGVGAGGGKLRIKNE